MVIVSADTHIGPLLVDQLREYCPKKYLDDFDDYVASVVDVVRHSASLPDLVVDCFVAGVGVGNLDSPGHYDMEARLKELDTDGVAAEVIFHASENAQPIPFRPLSAHFGYETKEEHELAGVGNHIYNRWLVDVCTIQPERHAGLAYLPIWDVEAAVKELEWAREAGLRGVNFPAMRGDLPAYNSPVWDRFWSACEDLEMPLVTHIGGSAPGDFKGRGGMVLKLLEDSHIFGYRAVHWMLFSGVFERHPRLKMVITEIAGDWWSGYIRSLQDVWEAGLRLRVDALVPRPPSEYMMRNVYFGASFMAPFEAQAAENQGYVDRVMWGSDYPHIEGTWQYGFDHNGESATRLALRNTFAGIPAESVRQMTSETAIGVFGLDRAALEKVAARIEAPTVADLATAPEVIPDGLSNRAFRTSGTWT
jgi:predicted TIM-barrel fold metal-dependent hydrolase